MFCVNCGARMADNANFCTSCGKPVSRPAAAAPAAPPVPPRVEDRLKPVVRGKCSWCGAVVEGGQATCPRCGAATGMPETVAPSGWAQLPARKDMAKLQFGNSFCQIEGMYVPVADMKLAPEDSVYFSHHVLLWKDPQVDITTMSLAGGWKRLFAGLPLIMTQAQGPGHIAFSMDVPGELIALPLQPGQVVDVCEHRFLAATSNVQYGWYPTHIWLQTGSGNDRETHYPIGMNMDQFGAQQTPGLLLLHAGGNVFVRTLGPGESILIKPTALIFKDPGVRMQLHFERPSTIFSGWGFWSNQYLWLRMMGPGRVAIQSVFERIEAEARNLTACSAATEQRW